jgi:hypothetical protein
MIADVTLPLPVSLASLLAVFGPLFTAPSFRTFCGLACGFLAQTGRRTVCAMLVGAGLSRLRPHDNLAVDRLRRLLSVVGRFGVVLVMRLFPLPGGIWVRTSASC